MVVGLDEPGPGDDSAIAQWLAQRRRSLVRLPAAELARAMDAGALVVDIRTLEQRDRDGALPGALVVDRTVLEWRLDPTSPYRLRAAETASQVVVVCNEGYSSSLAAWSLQQLGVHRATDLIGGYQAWLRAQATAHRM